MFRNYLKIAFRNLSKNSVYSFINIFGLAVGLSSSLLITLWVIDEYTYDGFHAHQDKIYQVYINSQGDNGINSQRPVPLPLIEEFKTNERDIKYASVTSWGENNLLVFKDKRLMKNGLYASEDFLKMFSFDLIEGNAETALKGSNGIVLTQSTAQSLFGNEPALGKIVHVDNIVDVTVTGVVKDVPQNSSFQFDCLLPFDAYISSQSWVKNSLTNWFNNSFQIYVQLADDADKSVVENRVKDVIRKHGEGQNKEGQLMFHPMSSWRLYSQFENGKVSGGLIEQVRMFTIIAVFILIIACINFMNLATARSEKRSREVGIRKTVGSRRKELIFQFLGESIFIVAIAFLLAMCITEASLPFYNSMVDKKLFIDYSNPVFWLIAGAIVLLTGLISGSYPAFYLSAFNPVTVLKGKNLTGQNGATPRKVLVTLQFFFSIFLIIGTIVFNQQMNYGKDRSLGYDQENLISIENLGDIQKNYQVIKNKLIQENLAVSVTESSSPVTAIFSFMGGIEWSGKREDQRASIATIATSNDYVETLGLNILEGRSFSEEFNDSLSVILNKAAIDYMGLKNPLGEEIIWDERKLKVVGVVDNTIMASVYQPIAPMMIIRDPSWFAYMTVRLSKTDDMQGNLKRVEGIFREFNPAYPFNYTFVDVDFARKFSRIKLITNVANIFAVLAIMISCLGLFGLAAYTAEQRTREIGIRKVMGASVPSVIILLSRDFARLVILAFVLAGPLAWWALDKWLQSYPYRIEVQWWTLGIAGAITFLIAVITVSSQALKAAVSNPAHSLRSE